MQDAPSIEWTLVARYLGGELSSDEYRAFERWIAIDVGRHEEMVLVRQLWDTAATVPSVASVDRMWRSVRDRIETTV